MQIYNRSPLALTPNTIKESLMVYGAITCKKSNSAFQNSAMGEAHESLGDFQNPKQKETIKNLTTQRFALVFLTS